MVEALLQSVTSRPGTKAWNAPKAPGAGDTPLKGYLPTLDGWRAIAVSLVIGHHSLDSHMPEWLHGLSLGSLGVDIFFGLSGFLICTRLLQEQRASGRISLKAFYVRRGFRILPPAWAYLFVLAVLTATGILTVTRSEFLGCLLFLRNYYPSGQHWYTIHFWSLAVEEHFYFLYPALLVLFKGNMRRACGVLAVLALGIATVRSLDTHILAWAGGRLPAGTFFWTRTHVRLDSLLWGCIAAIIVDRRRWMATHLLSAPFVLLILVMVVGTFFVPLSLVWRAILIPWLLVGTVLRPSTLLSHFLEIPFLRWVGRLSYSLYLWQQLFCVGDSSNRVPALEGIQTWPWSLAGVFICATISYYLIERPMIRLGHRLAGRVDSATL
jgi:peptidoglycan/LPS O-acetylase OafA/YrhL